MPPCQPLSPDLEPDTAAQVLGRSDSSAALWCAAPVMVSALESKLMLRSGPQFERLL